MKYPSDWSPDGRFLPNYDATADGKRFLVNTVPTAAQGSVQTPITVVLNWQAAMKR